MKLKIRNRILITICAVTLLSLAGQIFFNVFLSRNFYIRQQKKRIADAFEEIREGYDEELERTSGIAERLRDEYGIRTVIEEGEDVVYSSVHSFFTKGKKTEPPGIPGNRRPQRTPTAVFVKGSPPRLDDDELQLTGSFLYEEKEVTVFLSLPIAPIDYSIGVFTQSNIVISLMVLSIGTVAALILSKKISDPIVSIEAVSRKIAELDFSSRADENSSTKEIEMLAVSVNQMSGKLEKSLSELTEANEKLKKELEYRRHIEEERKNFIASVSHEMKTPLALLEIYAENLRQNVEGIDRAYYCDTILEETENLNRMISEMLEVSSIDNGFITLCMEPMDLSRLCREVLLQYEPVLCDYRVEIGLQENCMVKGDRKYLDQVIKNLLNNAVQHTEKEKRISVCLEASEEKVSFSVENEGNPIGAEDLSHIWDAFFRADRSRQRNENKNLGLGLTIVKTIVEKHGGQCRILNTETGVRAEVQLHLQRTGTNLPVCEKNT